MSPTRSFAAWRVAFVLGGLLIAVGGPMHPGGSMAEMLADPAWPTSHALITAGFTVLAAGWWAVARLLRPDERGWALAAAVASLVQAADYVVHSLAFLDAEAYVSGGPTPIFSTHMVLTPVVNPLYAVVLAAVIWHFQRRPGPGSLLYGWIGLLGAASHGAANLFVAGFGIEALRFLFPFVVLLALWHAVAGVASRDFGALGPPSR